MNDGVIDSNINNDSALVITPEIRAYLKETAKWAKFLAIVYFVFLALMIIMALFMGTIMGNLMSEMPPGMAPPGTGLIGGAFFTVSFLAGAALMFFPTLFLYRFATRMKTALAADDQAYLADSFKNLKSLYKFSGILMAVVIGFYLLSIVLAIFGGLFAMM